MNSNNGKSPSEDPILQGVEQVNSIENLYNSVHVITINGWLVLVFVFAFVILTMIWAFTGNLPTTVGGKCVAIYGDSSKELTIFGFLPLYSGQQVRPGMEAMITLDTVDSARYGMLKGSVKEVVAFPVNAQDSILEQIPSASLREYLTSGSLPTIALMIEPLLDPNTATGLQWTSNKGPEDPILNGSVGEIEITLKLTKPIFYVIP